MPEGHSREDLRAMGCRSRRAIEIVGSSRTAPTVVRQKPAEHVKSGFSCDEPERMTELTSLTIAQARDGLEAEEILRAPSSPTRISPRSRRRATLNAYVLETPEHARAHGARPSDARIANGDAGPLEGIPLGDQGLFCTKGVRTTACSRILDNFVPTYESTVTAQLWRDGAVMLGKTNNDEFAMGSSNETSCVRPGDLAVAPQGLEHAARSRRLVRRFGGGGGSATCLGATGTDTGGSIRQPAAFTGIVGIKPTYGRCSRWGIVAFASSLDQAGPFTRTVRDAAILLRSMAGHDPKDTTCADIPVPDYEAAVGKSVKGMRIGIPKEYRIDGMPAEIEKLWEQGAEWLKSAGAEMVEVSLPHTKYALPAYYIVAPAEASSNLARYDGVRYGLRVPGRDIIGMYETHARRRFRRGSAPPHHDRHLRALGWLLRRLLSARAEGANADQEGFRGRVRERRRRDADAGDAVGGFRRRREGRRRSGRDVSQRRVHGDGEHGGPAGHFGAGRT